jgi:hypothetical protein
LEGITMTDKSEFFSRGSSITPSAAGAVVVTISLALSDTFGTSVKWIALALSILLGLLLVLSIAETSTKALKGLYWVFNSLLVFSVSVGLGISVDSPQDKPPKLPHEVELLLKERLSTSSHSPENYWPGLFGLGTAFAQDKKEANSNSNDAKKEAAAKEASASKPLTPEQTQKTNQYLREIEAYKKSQERFNRRWSW